MKPDPQTARQSLINAQQALQRGDRRAARRWAEMTAALAPDWEEPWLILASLATPQASVTYLERALRINPQSERARAGMVWAQERLQRAQEKEMPAEETPQAQSEDLTQAHRVTPDAAEAEVASVSPETQPQPQVRQTLPSAVAQTAPPSSTPVSSKGFVKYRWSFLTLLVIAICLTSVWAFLPGNASSALAFLRAPQSTEAMLGAPADVEKPTYTPTFTPTFTPTATFTPSPTFTLTPSPTDTPIPTDTPPPTLTPWPSDTPIPWPTETPYVYPTTGGGEGNDTRWIDVNLSQQMLYAYEGDTVVASFLVSTGVWQFPTVTGQFHIYVKYVSTLMTGVGYYLPNVPYTMYFYEGYGIHGTYWHNNFGTPMSHGCVNMYTPDAEWLYNWASVGTLVNVHY